MINKCKNGLNTLQGHPRSVYIYSDLFLEMHQSRIWGLFYLEREAIEPLYGTLDSPRGRKKWSMAPPDALGLLLMFIFNYRHHFECDNVYQEFFIYMINIEMYSRSEMGVPWESPKHSKCSSGAPEELVFPKLPTKLTVPVCPWMYPFVLQRTARVTSRPLELDSRKSLENGECPEDWRVQM